MKLSTKSEYACLALIDLAQTYDQDYLTISEIIRKHDIPRMYLEQIMLILREHGYIQNCMETDDGFRLCKSPANISLAEIIRLFDGAMAPLLTVSEYFYEPSVIEQSAELMGVFTGIRNDIAERLENTSLRDLLPSAGAAS